MSLTLYSYLLEFSKIITKVEVNFVDKWLVYSVYYTQYLPGVGRGPGPCSEKFQFPRTGFFKSSGQFRMVESLNSVSQKIRVPVAVTDPGF